MKREQRVTSKDVARMADVSRATVSLVLNNVGHAHIRPETRQRVLDAARQLNYYPHAAAQSLSSQKAAVIALLLNQSREHLLGDPFLPGLILGLEESVRESGFHLLIQSGEDVTRAATYTTLFRTGRVDGAIISGPKAEDQELCEFLKQGFPVVLHGCLGHVEAYCVDVDNINAAALAVSHLVALGHRRIGLITNAPLQYASAADRAAGYRKALGQTGLIYQERLVRYGAFTAQSGYEAMSSLLDAGGQVDAVFIASDWVASGAMLALRRRGLRVPEDLAVVGFDDVPLAGYLSPPLTSVHLPIYELGWHMGELVTRLICGDLPGERVVVLPTSLVVRESCGARSLGPEHRLMVGQETIIH